MKSSDSNDGSRNGFKVGAEGIIPGVLILASVVVATVFSVVAAKRSLTSLEAVLLQAFGLSAALMGSFVFGRQSARKVAHEMIKPHARSAFRRLWSLYQSLFRLAQAIQEAKVIDSDSDDTTRGSYRYLPVLEAIVTEQLSTAGDALEDWRDLVPEDVQQLEHRIRERQLNKGEIENE